MPKGIMQCSVKFGASMGALTASLFAVQVHAQDAAPQAETGGLEEIIVTARKQSESMMKVPVTAAAVASEDLARNQITTPTALVTQIAAIRFDETAGGGGGTLTIRGIGSSTSDNGVDNTVAIVLDGLQTSRGNFTKVGFLDLGQVEVLKGPQALFFGKNSPGGVLSLTAARPTDQFEGYVRAGYTTGIGSKKVEAALSGPLGGGFRARLAGSYDDTEGWIENVLVENAPNPFFGSPGAPPTLGTRPFKKNFSKEALGRLTVDYDDGGDFTAAFRAQGIRIRNAGRSGSTEITSCGNDAAGNRILKPDFLGVPDPFNDCVLDHKVSQGGIHPSVRGADPTYPNQTKFRSSFDAYTAALTLNYSVGDVDLTSVTGYMDYKYDSIHQSVNSFGYGSNGVLENWDQFSQELRLVTNFDAPINFAGGVYFDSSRSSNHGPNLIFGLPADPRTPSASNPYLGSFWTYVFDGKTSAKTYSAFGQVRWKLIDSLEFDAGVRYSRDIRTGDVVHSFVNQIAATFGFLEAEGKHIGGRKTYDNFSPELTLTYTVNPDTIIFGSFRTGYKPGQAGNPNIVSVGLTDQTLFYQTETVKGFEAGFKTTMFNNTLRLTGAAFTYKYDDLQVSNFDSTKFLLTPLAGDMKTEGFELAATWQPIPDLRLNGAVGYTKARWTNFPGVACYSVGGAGVQPRPTGPGIPVCNPATQTQDMSGLVKFRSPDWSGNAGFVYTIPLDALTVEINGNMSFVSKYNSQENNSPFARQPGYELYDAGITFKSADDRYRFSVIGKNLSDVKYVGATYDQANGALSATIVGPPGQPRTVLFQVGVNF